MRRFFTSIAIISLILSFVLINKVFAEGLLSAVEEYQKMLEKTRSPDFNWDSPLAHSDSRGDIWTTVFSPMRAVVISDDRDYVTFWADSSVCHNNSLHRVADLYVLAITPHGRIISFSGQQFRSFDEIQPTLLNVDLSVFCQGEFVFPASMFYDGDGRYLFFVGTRPTGSPFSMKGWSSISMEWISLVKGDSDELHALEESVSSIEDVISILSQIRYRSMYQDYVNNVYNNGVGWIYAYYPKVVVEKKQTACGGFATLAYELIEKGLGYDVVIVSMKFRPERFNHAILIFRLPDQTFGYISVSDYGVGFPTWIDAVNAVYQRMYSESDAEFLGIRIWKDWESFLSRELDHRTSNENSPPLCRQELANTGLGKAFKGSIVLSPEEAPQYSFDEILNFLENGITCFNWVRQQ